MWRLDSIRIIAVLAAFYLAAVPLGAALFVAATKIGLFAGISIMFYRGLANLAVLAPVLVLLLAFSLRLPWPPGVLARRDAVAATAVAISLNLAAFVLGPVTVDRSVSVFMLSRLGQAPLTSEELRASFAAQYTREWDQIGRRLKEQIASRNVEQTSDGRYRLTPQGQSFMATARTMSWLFGGDPRFVAEGQPEHREAAAAAFNAGRR